MRFQTIGKILKVEFETSFELCSTSYRFSHYYEDAIWNNKIFSREDLDNYYLEKHGDKDHWKKRWAGFNLPFIAMAPFLRGEFDPLTPEEQELMVTFAESGALYVIGIPDDASYTFKHEMAHAFYCIYPEYREQVSNLIKKNMHLIPEVVAKVSSMGYSDDVLIDELHAYCGIYYGNYLQKINLRVPIMLNRSLVSIFEEQYNSELIKHYWDTQCQK